MRFLSPGSKCGNVGQLQRCLDTVLADFNEQYQALEDTERQAIRAAMVEERSRFCLLVACFKPVVDEEIAMMAEMGHIQEIMDQVAAHCADPYTLPAMSEQILSEIRASAESSYSINVRNAANKSKWPEKTTEDSRWLPCSLICQNGCSLAYFKA